MPLTKEQKLERLLGRSSAVGRTAIEAFELEPLPPEIVRAFPTMEAWRERTNERLKTFVNQLNTVVPA